MSVNAVLRRLKKALDEDNSLIVSKDDLDKHPGFTTKYLNDLGLTKADLRWLESHGFGKRGYIQLPVKGLYGGTRTETRWILLEATK